MTSLHKKDIILYCVGNGLYINLTNRCPCDCSFCIRNNGDGINEGQSLWLANEPTLNEVLAAINNIDLRLYNEVVFCGYGEPLERLDAVLKTADYIKQKQPNMPVRLNTNGLGDLINEKKTAAMLAVNIDSVSISLNASNKCDYVKLCRPAFGEKSFNALIDFANDSKECFRDVCMTVVDVIGTDKIEQCRQLCELMGIKMKVRSSL